MASISVTRCMTNVVSDSHSRKKGVPSSSLSNASAGISERAHLLDEQECARDDDVEAAPAKFRENASTATSPIEAASPCPLAFRD